MKNKLASVTVKIITAALTIVLLASFILNVSTYLSIDEIKKGGSVNWGYSCAIIGSGSMEPTFSINDLLLIKASDSYFEGEVVTFISSKGSMITHRIVEVTENGYITQGDANNISDEKIAEQRILGKAIYVIPRIGGIIAGVLSPLGIALLVGIFILLWLIQRIMRHQNEEDDENEKSIDAFEDVSGS